MQSQQLKLCNAASVLHARIRMSPNICYIWNDAPYGNACLEKVTRLTVSLGHTLNLILLLNGVTARHRTALTFQLCRWLILWSVNTITLQTVAALAPATADLHISCKSNVCSNSNTFSGQHNVKHASRQCHSKQVEKRQNTGRLCSHMQTCWMIPWQR